MRGGKASQASQESPGDQGAHGDSQSLPEHEHVDWLSVTEISDDDYRSFCLPCHDLEEPESDDGAGAERVG